MRVFNTSSSSSYLRRCKRQPLRTQPSNVTSVTEQPSNVINNDHEDKWTRNIAVEVFSFFENAYEHTHLASQSESDSDNENEDEEKARDAPKFRTNNTPIRIVVNSHHKNVCVVNQLLENRGGTLFRNRCSVLIVEGGHYNQQKKYMFHKSYKHKHVAYLTCNHNSIDFTALIALCDLARASKTSKPPLSDDSDVYFYMHDTCEVGWHFLKNLGSALCNQMPPHRNTLRLTSQLGYSMNIGFYRIGWLVQNKDFLESRRNTDVSREMEFKSKDWKEDELFRMDPTAGVIDNHRECQYIGPMDWYGTGVMRRVEYYSNLDLLKFKANWGQGGDSWTLRA